MVKKDGSPPRKDNTEQCYLLYFKYSG